MDVDVKGKRVLITGGTGAFGTAFARRLLRDHAPREVILLSRDARACAPDFESAARDRIRCWSGDVRDRNGLRDAFEGVDVVVHAAARRPVPGDASDCFEMIRTNVLGAANVIEAAVAQRVSHVVALSTDRAANPIDLYGGSKLCADKLFTSTETLTEASHTRFCVVRFGTWSGGPRGLIASFRRLRSTGVLPIPDLRMTRFWSTLDLGAAFVLDCLGRMRGGEVFVPKLASVRVADLARAIAPGCRLEVAGIRPGDKLFEQLIPEEEARRVLELDHSYLVLPDARPLPPALAAWGSEGHSVPDGFAYTSHTNASWLEGDALGRALEPVLAAAAQLDAQLADGRDPDAPDDEAPAGSR